MYQFIFSVFIFLIFLPSCTTENTSPQELSTSKTNTQNVQVNQQIKQELICQDHKECPKNFLCYQKTCMEKSQLCKEITCASESDTKKKPHGTCSIQENKPICTCDKGYEVSQDIYCEQKEQEVKCTKSSCQHKYGSVCHVEQGKIQCKCPTMYKETAGKDMCILNEQEACKNVKCDKNKHMTGFCKARVTSKGILKECECERGWWGKDCNQKEGGCDKSICLTDPNATGECYIDISDPKKETICICKDGYEYDEQTNKCELTQ